jgi:Fe-S-cluster containining protein
MVLETSTQARAGPTGYPSQGVISGLIRAIHIAVDIQNIIAELPSRAVSQKAKFAASIKLLRRKRAGEIEAIMNRLHSQAFTEISCLDCGNCCRSLGPRLTDRDVQRIGRTLGKTSAEVHDEYLKYDEDNDLVFRSLPCPFLGEDNFCFVYDSRPQACAEYPHSEGRQVRGRLGQLIKNSAYCPAVYRILELLDEELGR